MSMIERAAKAAYERFIEPVRDLELSWDDLPQSHRDRMIDSQRAAIEAMREPELMIVQAACDATFGPVPLSPEAAHMIGWRAMISTALKGEAE